MANDIADNYYHSMDREKERHLEIGTTLHEGAEGKFTQSVAGKIWRGAGSLDLQLETEQIQRGTGPGGYSKVAREEIRKLAELNRVNITSVHAPLTQGGYFNFTGLTDRGFNEDRRQGSINLLKRSLDFATDISTEGTPIGVTQHVGEFQRSVAHVKEKGGKGLFESTPDEENEASVTFVDDATGQFQNISRSQTFQIAERDENGNLLLEKVTDRNGEEREKVKLKNISWQQLNSKFKELGNDKKEFQKWANEEFKISPEIQKTWKEGTPDEAMLRVIFQDNVNSIRVQEGTLSAQREQHLRDAEIAAEKGDKRYAEILRNRAKSELESLEELRKKEHQLLERADNFLPQEQAGLKRTASSLGELGAYAFKLEREKKHINKPVHIAPEIWTSDVYGSHPDEIANIIEESRKEMVKRLTQKEITIPGKVWDPNMNEGQGGYAEKKVTNYYYKEGISEKQAKKIAEDRIKMTFDSNHLGSWWEQFKPLNAEETEEHRRKRFNKWYMDHLKKLTDKGYIAHAHIVQGIEGSGMHLPPGKEGVIGDLPMKDVVDVLRDHAFKNKMHMGLVSEGHTEGPERQLTEAWELTGRSVYALPSGGNLPFQDLRDQYLHHSARAPSYLFGELSSSQDEFKSWSEVPLE